MPRCPRCNKRPAKRLCPALLTSICPVCCARDRMMGIRCPESCTYLEEARNTEAEKAVQLLMSHFDPAYVSELYDDESCLQVMILIEATIANTQRYDYNDLGDSEIMGALNNAVKNLETAESGLIYEHGETSPRVQDLSLAIRDALEEAMAELPADELPDLTEIIEIIRFERAFAELLGRNESNSRAFVRHVALMTPWREDEAEPRIII